MILDRLFLEAKWLYNWFIADLNRLSLQPHKIKTLRLNWREVKPVERDAAARILGSNPYIRVSYLVEAGSPPL
jgi:hypothetical protein